MEIVDKIQKNFKEFFGLEADLFADNETISFMSSSIPHPCFNAVLNINKNLNTEETQQEVKRVIQKFKGVKNSIYWFVNNTLSPEGLVECLLLNGFKQEAAFNGMALELEHCNFPINDTENYTITIVDQERYLDDWIKPFSSFGFGDSNNNLICKKYKELFLSSSQYIHFIAYHGTIPVGSATLFLTDDIAGLYNLAVLPEYRNKGVGSFLQNYRVKYAKEKGYRYAITQANETSGSIARKIGFINHTIYTPYLYSYM